MVRRHSPREDRKVSDTSVSDRHARPSTPSGTSTNSGRSAEVRAMAVRPLPIVVGVRVPRHEDVALPIGRGRCVDAVGRVRR